MSFTPNIGTTHVEPGQAQIEVTINEALDNFDKAVAGVASFVATPGGTIALPVSTTTNMVLVATGAPSAAFNVQVIANAKVWIFINNTAQAATIKLATGTGAVVAAGKKALLYCDGINVYLVFSS